MAGSERKNVLLRLDPTVHDALAMGRRQMRSTNAQIEFLLRRALGDAGAGDARACAPDAAGRAARPPPPSPSPAPIRPGRRPS